MTRTTTVSGIRPDKAGDGEWIDINGHVGRLMSTLMADAGHSASTPRRAA